jgi:hypothetical protein
MNKILTILFLNLILISIDSSGQSLMRSSLSSIGSSVSGDGFILRQTIGQPSNTIAGKNGLMVLRQGFQQPLLSQNIIPEIIPLVFSLYPNPATERTLLEFSQEISNCSITITSASGIVVSKLTDQMLLSNWLDLKGLSPGLYIVTVKSDLRIGSRKLIVKQ